MNKQRIEYIDAAKGLGMILVCIGHAVTNAVSVMDVTYFHTLNFISQFHMPLFFVLSGMVFSDSYVARPLKNTLRKIKAYYIPFVAYNLLFVGLNNLLYKGHMVDEFYDIWSFLRKIISVLTLHVQPIGGAMWFMRSLMTMIIMFIWIRYFAKKMFGEEKQEIFVLLIVVFCALFGVSGKCPTVFKMHRNFYYMPFLYLGFLIKKNGWNKYLLKYKVQFILGGLSINVVMAFISTVGVIGRDTFQKYGVFLLAAVPGALMILALSQYDKICKNSVLKCIGKKSLDIMALHFLCFKIVSFIIIKSCNLDMAHMADIPVVLGVSGIWWLLYVISGLGMPILFRTGFNRLWTQYKVICQKRKTNIGQ